MENIIDTRKVNRSLFAWRVVDIHNDEFGFAQDGVIYTYATDVKAKSKGITWLRMQKTGEEGPSRRKYFLFFADETEASAYVDKHNDIYDMEGNYVASLIRSRFIIFLVIFIAAVIFFTGLALYLGGSMIVDSTSPFSEDKTIHLEDTDNTKGIGSSEEDIDLFDTDDKKNTEKNPIDDTKNDIIAIKYGPEKEDAKNAIREAAKKAKKAIDDSPTLTDDQKKELKAAVDEDADDAIKNIDASETVEEIDKALNDGLDEILDDLDDAIAWEFINKYCSNGDGDPYDKKDDPINKSNSRQVISGKDAYDELTDNQRRKVNKIIITPTKEEESKGYFKGEETYKNYAEMLLDASNRLPVAHGKFSNSIESTKKTIWPGIDGKFTFYVQNDGDLPLNYQLSLSEDNINSIPLRFKILINDEYVVGDETTWADTANYSGANIQIDPGEIVQYKIIWEWPDENTEEANARDTALGKTSAQYSIHATVYFEEVV